MVGGKHPGWKRQRKASLEEVVSFVQLAKEVVPGSEMTRKLEEMVATVLTEALRQVTGKG